MVTIELIEQPSIAELEAEIRATEEAGVAAIRQWVEAAWLAERKVAELEAQLATANETIADLRDFAYNRAPKNAAEEADRQKAEFEARIMAEHNLREEENAVHFAEMDELEAQLAEKDAALTETVEDATESAEKLIRRAEKAEARIAELEAQIRDAGDYAERLQIECSELEAEAGRLRAALEEIAKGDYKCDDWICDAPAMAQTALDELAGLGHERGREK